MERHISLRDRAIVACGTLNMELNHLKEIGFLDDCKILYTIPGRCAVPRELESQLIKQINVAKKYVRRIIIVYGGRFCYVNTDDPYRDIDAIIREEQESGIRISRIRAAHCVDMLASTEERERISQGEDVYWLTPGWIKYRNYVYQGWDKGLANETFPKHTGGAVVLDAVGYYDRMVRKDPESILDFSDWMGIPLESHKISLARLKRLLLEQIHAEEE